jgi:hypothetical protein
MTDKLLPPRGTAFMEASPVDRRLAAILAADIAGLSVVRVFETASGVI